MVSERSNARRESHSSALHVSSRPSMYRPLGVTDPAVAILRPTDEAARGELPCSLLVVVSLGPDESGERAP